MPSSEDGASAAGIAPSRGTAAAGAPAAPVFNAEDRPAPPRHRQDRAWVLLLGSVAVHAGIMAAIVNPPRPQSSAGIPAITVEIVLGDNAAAGLASSPGRERVIEVTPADAPALEPETVRPLADAESDAVPADVASPVLSQEVVAMAPAAPPVAEQRSESAHALTQPEHARRAPPAIAPEQVVAVSKPRRRARAPSSAAGGISRGGSTANANYQGRVAAHLARHKRYPPGARRRGLRGSAWIDFHIDRRGRVTTVRIVRSSGHDSLDRAAEAMVWRASPFPAAPDGRPQRFSVPISYSIP